MRVLTVNSGSTSSKVATVAAGEVERQWGSLDEALGAEAPGCVAHRVVHGGDRTGPAVLDDRVLAELGALAEMAPLHQPPALAAVARCRAAWPAVPQVAGFDTAFHTTIPEAARTYALPERYRREVRAYGFHGVSYQWASARIAAAAPGARRVLIAHLGGGQSMCAVVDGRSVMTTMGFTPLDGLVMATRPGSLDPGALLWLRHHHPDDDLDRILEHESGLLGLGGTADMRELHARVAAGDAAARSALDVWAHRASTLAGGCITAMGGVDALVFTGGVGEHDPIARAAIVDALAWLGAAIVDDEPRVDDIEELTAPEAAVRTFVVRSREDLQLAAEAESLLAG